MLGRNRSSRDWRNPPIRLEDAPATTVASEERCLGSSLRSCVRPVFGMLLRAHRDDRGVDGRPRQDRTATQFPRTTAPSQAKSVVSERRVAHQSRRLIDEIEQFLADHDSS